MLDYSLKGDALLWLEGNALLSITQSGTLELGKSARWARCSKRHMRQAWMATLGSEEAFEATAGGEPFTNQTKQSTNEPITQLLGSLVGWLCSRLVGWLVGWSVGWLVGWLDGNTN